MHFATSRIRRTPRWRIPCASWSEPNPSGLSARTSVMTDVREESPLGFGSLHDAQGILHRGVRRMRLVAKCIEKQNVQIVELGKGSLRDIAMVGKIGG